MGQILAGQHQGLYVIRFVGDVRLTLCITADAYFERMFSDPEFKSVLIDLSDTVGIDSTSLGLLAKLSIRANGQYGLTPTMVCANPDILRVLQSMGFEDVFNIQSKPPESLAELGVLPLLESSDEEMRQQILDAHYVLMGMNAANKAEFEDLINALENVDLPRSASI